MAESSNVSLVCVAVAGCAVVAALLTDHKWLYFVGGISAGFLFGALKALDGLHVIVKGRALTADEEEVVLKKIFKI